MVSAARSRWIVVLVLLIAVVIVWRMRRKPPQYASAYIADRSATLWNSTAQVRQPVATLGYGEKVMVLHRTGDQAQVQTVDGAQGWVSESLLMDPKLWQQSEELISRARSLPVQASGRTRNLSNVHLDPGRDTPRIYQFGKDVPVVVLGRKVLPAPRSASGDGASGPESAAPDDDKTKKEDWLLVSRVESVSAPGAPSPVSGGSGESVGGIPVTGWVLGRFIDLDPPAPLGDYVASAGLRVVSWEVVNTVPSSDGAKPQYVVAATRGGEGQPCDFTALRVYTWGEEKKRYETAYAESNLCGALPIRVQQTSAGTEFRFKELDDGAQERIYLMKQTIVRRVRESEALGTKKS